MSIINKFRMAPANLASGTRTGNVCGRQYSCAVGSTIDVVEGDAQGLEAQGFINLGVVGPTSQRPAYPTNINSDARIVASPTGMDYVDTTLSVHCTFNGAVWINAVTGAVV